LADLHKAMVDECSTLIKRASYIKLKNQDFNTLRAGLRFVLRFRPKKQQYSVALPTL